MKKIIYLVLFVTLIFTSIQAQTVYVTRTGAKYHSADCRYLRKSSIPIELKDAIDKGYTACSRCAPPILGAESPPKETNELKAETEKVKKTEVQKVERSEQKISTQKSYSGRCQATTKKGTQCKRKAEPGSNYCWQHNR